MSAFYLVFFATECSVLLGKQTMSLFTPLQQHIQGIYLHVVSPHAQMWLKLCCGHEYHVHVHVYVHAPQTCGRLQQQILQ